MNPKELNKIAKRLKELRTEKQLSLQELADRTGLTKSTLQRYETGNIGNIPLSKIDILAKGLDVNPHVILGWEENEPLVLSNIDGIVPVPHGKSVPVIGSIACGTPVLAVENIDGYIEVNPTISAIGTKSPEIRGFFILCARIMHELFIFHTDYFSPLGKEF